MALLSIFGCSVLCVPRGAQIVFAEEAPMIAEPPDGEEPPVIEETPCADGHAYGQPVVTKPATTTKNGTMTYLCARCGEQKSETIPAIGTIAVEAAVYTGKAVKPKVTIKDAVGNTIPRSDYTVTYSGNKEVGKKAGAATIQFTNRYKGTVSKRFSISLGTPKIVRATATAQKITLTWNKVTGATGYRVYRQSSDGTLLPLQSMTGTSFTDTNRNPGTTYTYVLKAYRTVGGEKFFSAKGTITKKTKSTTATIPFQLTERTKLYDAPSTKGTVLAVLDRGASVQVVPGYSKWKNGRNWYQIQYKGKSAYVSAKSLLRPIGASVQSNVNFQLSDSRKAQIQAAINAFSRMGRSVGFYLWDLKTDAIFCYNQNKVIYSASVMKGPYVCSVLQNYVETGQYDLDKVKFYRSNYGTQSGTGTIQYDPYNKVYTLREVMKRTIQVSDNMGYTMLRSKFGTSAFASFLSRGGVSPSYAYEPYPFITTEVLAKMWKQSSNYLLGKGTFVPYAQSIFQRVSHSFISESLSSKYTVYSKPGFIIAASPCFNDAGIVMAGEHPYVIAIMSNTVGWNGSDTVLSNKKKLQTVLTAVNALHDDYVQAIS
ncbi:MAG: serine hydrolase [Oscillospiraceae bacterium]|nr:serine hydrolase [Oscillospiraceae bacterium]